MFTPMMLSLLAARAATSIFTPPDSLIAAEGVGCGVAPLVASGLNAGQVGDVVMNVDNQVELRAAIQAAKAQLQSANDALTVLLASREQAAFDPQLREELDAASAAWTAAGSTMESTESALRSAALTGVSATASQRIHHTARGYALHLPMEFRVLDWEANALEALHTALIAVARAERLEEAPPEGAALLVASARAQEAVIQAQMNLATELQSAEELLGLE
ncbi:MAG: hypothetical protein H7Y88_04040 [Phycisphaerales bacterium]|nr:hypothetical protein [Phycisphaerales bacterium]